MRLDISMSLRPDESYLDGESLSYEFKADEATLEFIVEHLKLKTMLQDLVIKFNKRNQNNS